MSAIDIGDAARAIHFRILEPRTFWISHVKGSDKGWQQVQSGVRELIESLAEGEVWETPSFFVFASFATIDHIALMLRSRSRVKDVFLVGSFTHAECRVVGACDDPAIFDLVPFAKGAYGARPQQAGRVRGEAKVQPADLPWNVDAFTDELQGLTASASG
jgi:hypothetical protein